MHVKFIQINGERELGISVDLSAVNFNKGDGMPDIEETTNLNYNNVRRIVDIDFSTVKETGILEVI